MKAKEIKKLFAISTLALSIASMGMISCGAYGSLESYDEAVNVDAQTEMEADS